MLKKISEISSERILLFNLFTRNFSTAFSTIYLSSIFMIEIGSEKWPMILMYVQFFSLAFIISTNFIRSRHYYFLHKLLIITSMTVFSLFAISPKNHQLIIFSAVLTFAVDIIGEITATNVVSRIMSSIAYKSISPRLVSYSTSAYILGSFSVIFVQKIGDNFLFAVINICCLIFHLFLFSLMVNKALRSPSNLKVIEGENFLDRIKETLDYARKNHLIKLIFALFIWTQIAKFLCDWVYLSSASLIWKNKEDLSVFLSLANIGLMVMMFIFQKTLVKKIMSKFTPATLIGAIPISLLLGSIIAVISKRPEIGLLMNLFYIFYSRSIHNPTMQISLHSLDPKYKTRVILMLNFSISVSLILFTSSMRTLRGHFSLDFIYVSLLIMGILGLILMVRFEGPYFKNLWANLSVKNDGLNPLNQIVPVDSNLQEEVKENFFNPHHYFTEEYSRRISLEISDYLQILYQYPEEDTSPEFVEYFHAGHRTPFERLLLIMNVYVYAKNQMVFKSAVKAHQYLFDQPYDDHKEKALQILALIEVPECSLNNRKFHHNEEAKNFHTKMGLISEKLDEAITEKSAVHLRLKIFGLINWDYLTAANQNKFLEIINQPYSEGLKKLSLLLSNPRISNVKHDLLKSWIPHEARINTIELVHRYLASSSEKRKGFQKILQSYLPDSEERIEASKIAFHYARKKNHEISRHELLELLFIREWTALKNLDLIYVLDSINEYVKLSEEERKYWKDFHLEFLKKDKSIHFSRMVKELL